MISGQRFAILVALGLLVGRPADAIAPVSGPRVKPPKRVLVVLIDALRPDHVGAYGYAKDTSPSFDRLAAEGVLFTECRSTSTWTKPAVASLFSGVGPMVHGVEKGGLRETSQVPVLAPRFETLAELFRRNGVPTVTFTGNPHVSDSTGLTQGFDQVIRTAQFGPGLVDDFLRWLDQPSPARPGLVQRLERGKRNLLPTLKQMAMWLPPELVSSFGARQLELRSAGDAGQRRCASVPLVTVPQGGGPYLLGLAHRVRKGVAARVKGSSGWQMALPALTDDGGPDTASLRWVSTAGEELSLELCLAPGSEPFELSGMFLVPAAEARKGVESRWFAYLHLLNPHLPYRSSQAHTERFREEEYGDQPIPIPPDALAAVGGQRVPGTEDLRVYKARYDAAVHEADEGLGRIIDNLKSLGLLDDTLIMVTADHGQQFLEHGWLSHAGQPYEELLRVPLLVYYPKRLARGIRVTGAVSLLDLYPTLAEVLRFDPPDLLAGCSLDALLTGRQKTAPGRPFVTTHTSMAAADTSRTDVVVDGDLELLVTTRPGGETGVELYDLRADPGETRNLVQERPEDARRLRGMLDAERLRQEEQRARVLGPVRGASPDPATVGLLKALGYAEE